MDTEPWFGANEKQLEYGRAFNGKEAEGTHYIRTANFRVIWKAPLSKLYMILFPYLFTGKY